MHGLLVQQCLLTLQVPPSQLQVHSLATQFAKRTQDACYTSLISNQGSSSCWSLANLYMTDISNLYGHTQYCMKSHVPVWPHALYNDPQTTDSLGSMQYAYVHTVIIASSNALFHCRYVISGYYISSGSSSCTCSSSGNSTSGCVIS